MRVAIYSRVSTERQKEEETIKSQTAQLEKFAQENNLTIVGKYEDDGWSGEILARPGLDKLRDDAPNKLFDVVIILCPDRLARKYIYQEIVIEELKKCGIKVVFLNRQKSEDTPEERMLLGVQGLFADYEKEKIKERTRRGKLHKAKKGLVIGNIPPYGYRYIKKNGR